METKPLMITSVEVSGFPAAIRGMRNPYESFGKSDSARCLNMRCEECPFKEKKIDCINDSVNPEAFVIGNADMALCKNLIKGGSEHRKFLRMIHIQCDIKAPRYWWQEFDTYKVGTVENSSSTMHLITKRSLTLDDICTEGSYDSSALEGIVTVINEMIEHYNSAKSKILKDAIFRAIKQTLPEGLYQLRTVDFNYETAITMYHQRKNHRLAEWKQFTSWIETLPYMGDFLGLEGN